MLERQSSVCVDLFNQVYVKWHIIQKDSGYLNCSMWQCSDEKMRHMEQTKNRTTLFGIYVVFTGICLCERTGSEKLQLFLHYVLNTTNLTTFVQKHI